MAFPGSRNLGKFQDDVPFKYKERDPGLEWIRCIVMAMKIEIKNGIILVSTRIKEEAISIKEWYDLWESLKTPEVTVHIDENEPVSLSIKIKEHAKKQ